MKLYYAPGACSLADRIALNETGLPFETDQVDLKAKTTAGGKDYNAINPKGYVPALELGDGTVLTENIAILSYIADKAGKLVPPGDLGQFRLLEALAYISTELHKGFKPFFMPDSTEDEKAAARETLTKRFALFEQQLSDRAFVLGPDFSAADCYLFVMLFWAKTKVGMTMPANLGGYYDRLADRPAIRQSLADEELA